MLQKELIVTEESLLLPFSIIRELFPIQICMIPMKIENCATTHAYMSFHIVFSCFIYKECMFHSIVDVMTHIW